jgi:putative ABC transport system permease protein
VNEALVRSGLLGDTPVGRRLYFGAGSEPWEVVGVVQDFVRFGLAEVERPAAYFDARQRPALPGMPGRGPYVVVKTQQPGLDSLAAIRAAVRAVDADATVIDVASMDDIIGSVRARPRLYAALTTVFAVAALLIAAAGIAGVVAYVVAQRRRETGIRLSLGATPARVVGEFVAEVAWRTAAGTVTGLTVAAGLATWLRGMLFGVQPHAPGAFVAAAAVIAVVAIGAAGIPARRAASVNSAESLRAE